jgi:hypothetical protein
MLASLSFRKKKRESIFSASRRVTPIGRQQAALLISEPFFASFRFVARWAGPPRHLVGRHTFELAATFPGGRLVGD